ncbi:MAG: MATE family efflux transporter [Bacteroidota bacterium]|nr:MATE family efflux transporter [Bacteroidota bacterium]
MTNPATVTNKLGTERIGKLIWDYSLPAIVGTVVMSLYNIIDRIFIGQGVGPLAISGLALTFPFMILLMAFGMLIGAGSAARISITLGEGNRDKAEKILANAFTLTIIISGTAVILSYIFMSDVLRLFGGTEKTIHYAEDFMRVIIPGGVFSALSFGFNNIMRASGYPRKAMYVMIICAILNTILDPIFIFWFHWGIQGTAFATDISYIVGTIWVLSHFTKKNSNLRFYRKYFRLEKDIVLSIISIGMSPFSMQLATSLVIVVINSTLIHYGGDLAIGAFGIINSVNTLVIMFIIGLNQGTQPIVGYNFGAKMYDRMFRTLKYAVITATCLTTIGFSIGTFMPTIIASFFTRDVELQAIASKALRISVIMFPIIGSQIVITNFFQSIGKAKISILLSLTRQFLFLIPCLLILPPIFGLTGAWSAMPVSDGLSAIIATSTILYFIPRFKHKATIQDINAKIKSKNRKLSNQYGSGLIPNK